MANVNVTYEEMSAQAGKLTNGRTEIETQLHTLQSQVQDLVAGGFVTDTASQAFNSSYEEFTKGVSKVLEGLDGMADYLNKAADAFKNVDSELAKALG
ncbi:WXG100 family type VII secretion target [Nocardioides acrostichi]|uniref:ESAT-6-like protein n=1 Tax=Nocardioides acrostichi TaxID=2784339 RepID=A0A930UWD5_9ACTN|nr:WXG100 family type VII secretion target [Nocardioides acrostichi]MBF4160285.1 WXG100 family type VII secretion target [Nocardioides acrostichi]